MSIYFFEAEGGCLLEIWDRRRHRGFLASGDEELCILMREEERMRASELHIKQQGPEGQG